MSSVDLWMRDILASYGIIVSIILCVVIWMIRKWPTLRKDIYRAHLLGFEMECAELASPYKEHLFKALQYIVSNDEMLRSMGAIRILEIGVKTGANIILVRTVYLCNFRHRVLVTLVREERMNICPSFVVCLGLLSYLLSFFFFHRTRLMYFVLFNK